MKILNLGCGSRLHNDWINVDLVSSNKNVIAHNLLNGIPFIDNEFDAVYHSHVLEHFSREDGKKFIAECYRVLKSGEIIRIAVPDLEQIVKNYLSSLESALAGDSESALNYEWMMLELYDQTVRNYSGGEMAKYFYQEKIQNEEFVYNRIGLEGKNIRKNYLKAKNQSAPILKQNLFLSKVKRVFMVSSYKNKLKQLLFADALKYIGIGKFRLGGEIHQWMYDRYSLSKLLTEAGFTETKVRTAFESNIPDWNSYELESKNGIVYKPDSLFMEAIKK